MTLSMRTTDHLHLPPLTVTTTPVALRARKHRVYDLLKADMVIELDGQTADASNAAALSGKPPQLSGTLPRLASGAVDDEHGQVVEVRSAKVDTLEDLIEAANGQHLLVAYCYRRDLERIHSRFPHARELKTLSDITAWNYGEIVLGLIHPASAGHGLNLQAGGHLHVWFSLTWSLELYQPTNARLHRQDQREPVTITHLATTGTLDDKALAALQDFHLMEANADENTEQTAEQLRDKLASPASPRMDGMPHNNSPHAGEQRIAATLDKIDLLIERKRQAMEDLEWFLPVWALLSEDDRIMLQAFFLGEGSQEDAVGQVCNHFYVERTTAHQKKSRTLFRLATALYGRTGS